MNLNGRAFDAGGETYEYLKNNPNIKFSWMKETILLNKNLDLFWGTMDVDIEWIQKHFSRCDKCGLEIFVSPFNTSDAVFYHMISASSEWRFSNQVSRRQSVRKVQQMRMIPFYGNLTCTAICKNTKIKI